MPKDVTPGHRSFGSPFTISRILDHKGRSRFSDRICCRTRGATEGTTSRHASRLDSRRGRFYTRSTLSPEKEADQKSVVCSPNAFLRWVLVGFAFFWEAEILAG